MTTTRREPTLPITFRQLCQWCRDYHQYWNICLCTVKKPRRCDCKHWKELRINSVQERSGK